MDFDWKALGTQLAKLGLPILGTALGGPAGAAIGGALASAIFSGSPDAAAKSTPETLSALLAGSADALRAAKEYEMREKAMLLDHCLAMEKENTAQLQAVNATLQADSKGVSWLQQNHHAIECLWMFALVTSIYVALPLLKVAVPSVPSEAWLALGAVLGIATWHNGRTQLADTLGDKWGADKK